MSYCVNCGVKLDDSLIRCPLCNTKVINPNETEDDVYARLSKRPPYPASAGEVDEVKRRDLGIFFSVILGSTVVTCGLLNLFIFTSSLWSLIVIGLCFMIWVFIIPAVIYTKLSIYFSFLLDGLIIIASLFLMTYNTGSQTWFWYLGLPTTILLTVLVEIFTLLVRRTQTSIISGTIYFFIELGIFCISLELLIRNMLHQSLMISWSAIVGTVCVIIILSFIAILSRSRWRDEIRKRLHF